MVIACSSEKSQSCQIGNALKRYNTSISREYLRENSTGSMTFHRDLEIFWPFTVKNPVVRIFFGNSYQALWSIAGQKIAWNLIISLPTICRSAGQNLSSEPLQTVT
jgi:hypothetical protein